MYGEEGFAGKAKLIRKWCLVSTTEAGSGILLPACPPQISALCYLISISDTTLKNR